MSHQNGLPGWLSGTNLDTTLAKIGILASLLLLGLRLLTAQVLLVVIPVATGVACVLYFGVHRRQTTAFEHPVLPGVVVDYLPAAVVVGMAALVGSVWAAGGRTPVSYLLIGAIGSAILAQSLLVEKTDLSPSLVVAQILVSAVMIRLSALFVTPGFVGVDVWTHIPDFVAGIVETGSLSAIADSKYIMAPFYHTIGAIGTLVFGSARMGVYLSIGLLVPLSALLVYVTTTQLLGARWALVATTLFAFSGQFIRWGIHIIPTSLGVVFFLGAVYCVTRLSVADDLWLFTLLVTVSLATVFTHQVSTAVLLVFLAIASVAFVSTRLFGATAGPSRRSVGGLVAVFLVTLVVTAVSWTATPWIGGESFLVQMAGILRGTLVGEAGFLNLAGGGGGSGGGGGGAESVSLLADILPFIEWFGFALLFAASIVGGLAMLRGDHPPALTATYILGASTMFVIIFGFSLFGVRAILPGRWMAFMYALLAIMAAVGLAHLSGTASKRVLVAVFVLLAVSYPMSMAVTQKATLDSPAFDDTNPRYAYTASEIAAVETISKVYTPEEAADIDTDHPYYTLFGRLGGYTGWTVAVDDTGPATDHPVIHREYQTTGPATVHLAGEPPQSVRSSTVDPGRICPASRNHVYANGDVTMCTISPITGGST
ncbi:ArnT family glycosyltransferase [Halonotius roseus]|uniref:Glycosyltransferase RgtA/B/C/D-like domain-containing protein n=1 Tax=Halonotius roseus TaxID=2511997 RepID=A0A544QMX4_9EURY|nr:glycosyltransferase family 39 protein [Halonotius roseus]TQQ80268.1 hypothetical protein EWF95_07165 [Halonotius roseus]